MRRCDYTSTSSSTWRERDRRGIRVLHGLSGPGSRRARIAWLRRHLVRASAFYVNTVGRALGQIRQEADLHDVMEDYLDQADWSGRAADDVRREMQAYVAGRADLAWAMRPAAPPSLLFRMREAVHEVAVPVALVPLLPALALSCRPGPCCFAWPSARQPITERPTLQHLEALASYEDYIAQNPFAVVGFIQPGPLRLVTIRGVMFALNYAVRHVYNGASLGGITTIHFARWVPLDGWRRMTFASNYDGAVEAYNDDFIDEVWWGLNAAFGNATGYPPTRWLFWGGAKYEQQFKNTPAHPSGARAVVVQRLPMAQRGQYREQRPDPGRPARRDEPRRSRALALAPVRHPMAVQLDLADIQGLFARGYKRAQVRAVHPLHGPRAGREPGAAGVAAAAGHERGAVLRRHRPARGIDTFRPAPARPAGQRHGRIPRRVPRRHAEPTGAGSSGTSGNLTRAPGRGAGRKDRRLTGSSCSMPPRRTS